MQRTVYPPAGPPTSNSALRGATLAFRASPSPSNPYELGVAPVSFGALAAASKAGTNSASKDLVKLNVNNTGDASLTAGRVALKRSPSQASSIVAPVFRESSPSLLAATRAASKSRSPVAQHESVNTGIQPPRRIPSTSSSLKDIITDDTPIPPTNRLVQLFEAKQRELPLPQLKITEKELEKGRNTVIISPKPIRPLSIDMRAPVTSYEAASDPVKLDNPPKVAPRTTLYPTEEQIFSTSPLAQVRKPPQDVKHPRIPPTVTAARRTIRPKSTHHLSKSKSAEDVKLSPIVSTHIEIPPRVPPSLSRNGDLTITRSQSTIATPMKSPISTTPILTRRLTQMPLGKLKPQLTADSLANAMVASALASSRAPSPTHSSQADSVLRKQSSKSTTIASLFLLQSPNVSSSPAKVPPSRQTGLRQTLRREASSPSEDEHHKRSHHHHKPGFLVKKHPNKHAEGARNRWRDSITEPERKRYEGVWAANRGGMLMRHEMVQDSTADVTEEVHGYVVKDLWSRSGLGARVLNEVWELVECGGRANRERNGHQRRRGRLKRDEFIVGLWLVDQCLKGRKLPVEVQESVWSSARTLMRGLRTR